MAKRVLSLPILTFFPAKNFVPLWRIIITPGAVFCPSESFTPKYFGWESRPNRDAPPDFDVAIFAVANVATPR